jgi:hypothetical protein
MRDEFKKEPREPGTISLSPQNKRSGVKDMETDFLELRDPVEPPPGLMRKRSSIVVWLVVALFLGGLIALIFVGLAPG